MINKELSETKKHDMPCFCYIKKIVCYIWKNKIASFPYIVFVNANKLKLT